MSDYGLGGIARRSGLDLSKWQMRDLSVLNMADGNMWPELVARRRDKRECDVYMAREPEWGRIVAWALVYATPKLGGSDFHVYVKDNYRREGYGSALYDRASDDHGRLRTFAPDDNARNFYAALDNRAEMR